jgi:hypothetical protein
MINKMLFFMSVASCLSVLYVYVHHLYLLCCCNHGTIIYGYLPVLFGLCYSCFISIPFRFPHGVVVLFETSWSDVPILFITVFLQCDLFFCRFILFLICVWFRCVSDCKKKKKVTFCKWTLEKQCSYFLKYALHGRI